MNSDLSFSTTFYIRQSKSKTKDYNIYCCIKAGVSKPRELCIPGSIKREDWNIGKGYPKQSRDDLIHLSLFLNDVKAKLYAIYYEARHKGDEVSADLIKRRYLGEDQGLTILQLMDKVLDKYKAELTSGSLKNYGATRKYVAAFCKMKYPKEDIALKYLTYAFIDELKTYILTTPLKSNDPCHNNGCMKHLERVKKIITWAHEMHYIDRDVFLSYKIRKQKYNSKYLRLDQLQIIEQKKFQMPMIALVRDLFVFCCYTGMAPIDMQLLQPSKLYTDKHRVTWVTYTRAKSNNQARVPLLKQALTIVRKYLSKENTFQDTLFPFVPNQTLNKNLKIIGETCELGSPLNFYMARHTFATTIALLHGVPVTAVKEMMGHGRLESTMIYSKINTAIIAKYMKQAQRMIDKVRS